jgi:uncharacterized membrane protein
MKPLQTPWALPSSFFPWVVASGIALMIARRGYRKQSLSLSGALAAFAVGFLSLGSSLLTGVVLLAFYFSGSAFTRYKSTVKAHLDLEHKPGGGQRNVIQVFATAGFGTAILLLRLARFGFAGPLAPYWVFALPREPGALAVQLLSRPISWLTLPPPVFDALLLLAYVGSFSTVCGDTWASELGVLSRRPPILLTDLLLRCRLRRVPRGTNGGVSGWGTVMSAAGGTFIGLIAYVITATRPALECAGALRGSQHHPPHVAPPPCQLAFAVAPFPERPLAADSSDLMIVPLLWLVPLGLAAGVVGSVIDSVLGAVLQRSWVQTVSGKATARLPPGAVVLPAAKTPSEAAIAELAQLPFTAALGDAAQAAAAAKGGQAASGGHSHVAALPVPASSSGATAVHAVEGEGLRHRGSAGAAGNARKAAGSARGGESRNEDTAHPFAVICGHDLCSNETVNLLSASMTGVLTAAAAAGLVSVLS